MCACLHVRVCGWVGMCVHAWGVCMLVCVYVSFGPFHLSGAVCVRNLAVCDTVGRFAPSAAAEKRHGEWVVQRETDYRSTMAGSVFSPLHT